MASCSLFPYKGLVPSSSLGDEGTWAGAGFPISILLDPLFLLTGLGEWLLGETKNSWLHDFSDFGRACQTLGISLPLSHQESMDLCLGFRTPAFSPLPLLRLHPSWETFPSYTDNLMYTFFRSSGSELTSSRMPQVPLPPHVSHTSAVER